MPVKAVPIPKSVNPALVAERSQAPFNPRDLAIALYGSEKRIVRRQQIIDIVRADPDFQDDIPGALRDREDRMGNVIRKTTKMVKYAGEFSPESIGDLQTFQTLNDRRTTTSLVIGIDPHPLSLHFVMFLPTLQAQGTEEQHEKWLSLAMTCGIVGTYAQTEIGHGTNIRALETTAEFDRETDEFVLNTPTITSTKCWPGCLGKSSNFAIVIAQLVIDEQKLGTHSFLVQIRDLETHEPMPGITVGDIGTKFGYGSNDNGFMMMKNVRIPRDQMLMKYAQVQRDGTYVRPVNAKLGYGTMVYVRSIMISEQAIMLAKVCTIATRYSAIRRQGEIESGSGEVCLLDYGTQRNRILPAMAASFAWWFVGMNMLDIYAKAQGQGAKGDMKILADVSVWLG